MQIRRFSFFPLMLVYADIWAWWSIGVTAYNINVKGLNMDWYMKGREGFYFSHPLWFKSGKP